MEPERLIQRTITVRGKNIVIYHYELFLLMLKDWKARGMSREDIEDLLLS